MKAPSTSLLRAFLKPSPCTCQTRSSSNFMPRHKFAAITRLDKLHRQQRAADRQEHIDSINRANIMSHASIALTTQSSLFSNPSKPSTTSPSSSSSTSTNALPYRINRTSPGNLPIYEIQKAGGNKHLTEMRKLSGDLTILQTHLREVLDLPDFIMDRKGRKKETVAINSTTKHIIVRGWRGPEIKRWAELVGF